MLFDEHGSSGSTVFPLQRLLASCSEHVYTAPKMKHSILLKYSFRRVAWAIVMLAVFAATRPLAADPAAQKKALTLWDTYMGAAATAVKKRDLLDAEVLWKCAVQVADQMQDRDRLLLSRTMLFITAVELKDQATADELKPLIINWDIAHLDDTFLRVSHTLGSLGSWYDNKGREGGEDIYLEIAERCFHLQWAIQKKTMSEPDAYSLGLYGLVLLHQRQSDKAREKLEQALIVWDKQEQRMKSRALAGSQFCVLGKADPNMEILSATPLYLEMSYARAYFKLGEKETSASNEDFAKSEELYRRALGEVQRVWPRGETAASIHYGLAEVYTAEKKYPDAEANFNKSLQLYGELEGQQSENVKWVAKELAVLLRAENRAIEAQQIERKYGVSEAALQ
jgi:tetratricopeptide (TPR) repeat protein